MRNKTVLLLLLVGHIHADAQFRQPAVPALAELGSDWMKVAELRNFPSVMNFSGGLQTTQNITGFQNLTFPPFAQGGSKPYSWEMGLNSPALPEDQKENGACAILLNGRPVTAADSRWLPYEVQRKATIGPIEIQSAIRLPFEQRGVLIRCVLLNRSSRTQTFTVSMDCYGRLRKYPNDQWQTWSNIRPADSNFIMQASDGQTLLVRDRSSPAVTGFSGTIHWHLTLAPGKTRTIEMVCAIGNDAQQTTSLIHRWATNFSAEFEAARTKWEQRWKQSFVPGNDFFSGHFPTLITNDRRIRRVYYMGVLTPLLMCRTDLPLSPRCFVTAGPQWANTLTYFWDAEMWANTWAMLEPVTMKQHLLKWLSLDIHRCYAVDCMSGGGAGPWYAANDWSVFRCIEAYLGVTGDNFFLQEWVDGKSVLQHLDEIACFYETRQLMRGSPLANYGGPANLLECSPSYIQGVPSLNAANIYLLRKTAAWYGQSGNDTRAAELRAKAASLLPYVLSLYDRGVWDALDSTGKKVPIRHCYDYITIGQALENDLSPLAKAEMDHFVESELLTNTWMRAMSEKDPAAGQSDRPDHGPMGSYDAWLPMTMDVLCRFGDFDRAVAFLRATESVTHLGSWSQSHEFTGPDSRGFNPVVRTASRGGQDANEGCGAAFAEAIIRGFFGFRPDLSVDHPVLLSPDSPRKFSGQLRHVPWKKGLYTIVSDAKGVHITLEK